MKLTDNQLVEIENKFARARAERRAIYEAGVRAAIELLKHAGPIEYDAAEELERALERGEL
jgi:hypothetical protein